MFAIERHESIINLLNERGNVTISELVKIFEVSSETIRKDLLLLEKENRLLRTHGGAVSKSKRRVFGTLAMRKNEYLSEKRELSETALNYIKDGDVISLDEGSTTVELAKLLVHKYNELTVVTHSLDVFNVLSDSGGIKTILCGGEFVKDENAFVGYLTTEAVSRIFVDKAFICPSAVSLDHGIFDFLPESKFLDVQRAYMSNAEKIFILADSSKFEKKALLKLCDVDKSFTYITDSKLDDEIYKMYRGKNIDLVKENVK